MKRRKSLKFFKIYFTACFRRVLAGKRIASHWVRRTLICERLEDCQRECGDEKRFSCEGFNYRLDPSGRGQGDCELIEVPLSRMDLYSSPHNRDSNLISHPDYDYFERDRTSTNCRASPCTDCGSSKPGSYRPQPNNDRDRYTRPEVTAMDKYRPQNHFYEARPEPDSWDRYGGSNYFSAGGGSNYDRPPPPPPPQHGYNVDRYGVEEHGNDYHRPPPPQHRPPSDHYQHRPDPPSHNQDHYHRPDPIAQTPDHYHRPDPIAPPSRPIADLDYNRPPPPRPSPDLDYNRPQPVAPLPPKPMDFNRPDAPPSPYRPQKPIGDYDRPDPPYRPSSQDHQRPPPNVGYGTAVELHHHEPPQSPPPRPGVGYADRESNYRPTNFHQKPFIPYQIGENMNNWGTYGGSYGQFRPQMADYWGLKNNEIKRKDGPNQFNYFELGPHEENSVYNRYGSNNNNHHHHGPIPMIEGPYRGGGQSSQHQPSNGGPNWSQMWTRRPGTEGEKI